MKKHFLSSFLVVFAIVIASAQESTKTTTTTTTTTTNNSSDLKKEISTMTDRVKSISKDIEDKKIEDKSLSRDLQHEVETLSNAAEDLSDKIDDKLDEDKEDNITKKIEKKLEEKFEKGKKNDDDKKDDASEDATTVKKKAKKEPRRTRMFFQIAYGLTDVQGKTLPGNLTPSWRSYTSEWAIMLQTRIGNAGSPVGLRYGVNWATTRIQTPNHELLLDTEGLPNYSSINKSTQSSATRLRYLTVPVSLEFKLGKHGSLGLGGYAGVRINAKSLIEYTGSHTEEVSSETRHPFGTNLYTYGLRASLGYRGLSVYGNYPLSNVFDKKYTDVKAPTVGLVWGF